MKLSVVTIVFNDFKHIEKTILSVLNQTYNNIEYIIIDGASTDGTVDIIKKFKNKIAYFNSEPDKGLYDAMNKGINNATGDYICFLNSGDLFYDYNTVANIFSNENKNTDVFYGETVIIDEEGSIKGLRRLSAPENLNWKSFKKGMLVSHQAFIPSMKIVPKYNLKYKYSSDFDWCIRILKDSKVVKNVNTPIIRYLDGGLTKKRLLKSLRERFTIMVKFYGFFTTILIHIKNAILFSFFVLKNKWF